MPPARHTHRYESRPPTRLRFPGQPTLALGSIYQSPNHGRTVARMRYYRATFRSTPYRLHLPCIIVAVCSINAARLVRLVSHIDSDDRYDYFEFDAVADDAYQPDDLRIPVADISIPAFNGPNENPDAIDRPEPETSLGGRPLHNNRRNYPKE